MARTAPASGLAVVLAACAAGGFAQEAEDRFQFGGWVRSSLEVGLDGAGFDPRAPDPLEVPRDRLVARQQAHLRQRYARGRSFEVVLSGLVTHDTFAALRELPTRTRFETELREAWLGFYTERVDLRLGNQRVAWGQADAFPVNDVVNARDVRDPVLIETELRTVPTFVVRGDAAFGAASVQVVFAPFFRADRYDVYGTNWSFLSREAPPGYRGFLGAATRAGGLAPEDAGRLLLSDGRPPDDDLSGLEGGARLEWTHGRVTGSHYYHHGRHGTPDFQVDPALGQRLDAIDWRAVGTDAARALAASVATSGAVRASWPRRHHFGLGVSTTAGPLALRLDAAYQRDGLFYDRHLNGWRSPLVQAVAAVELSSTDPGRALLVEVFQHWLERRPPPDLLFAARASTAVAVLARHTWHDRLELEMRVVGGISPRSYVLRPQVAWKKDALALRLGAVLPGGEDLAYGGWFGRNQGVYLMLRRSF